MINFKKPHEEVQNLTKELSDQIKLIRALANFHVNINSNGDRADLENQRIQISNSVKKMEGRFSKLAELWEQFIKELKSQTAYDPEANSQNDLITKFVRFTVPSAMQSKWNPDDFTGSLLVFFKDGKIDSSSLLEKKLTPGRKESSPDDFTNALPHRLEKPVRVVTESSESFTVLKTRNEFKFNIYFSLSEPENVTIRIYDSTDKLVRLIEKHFDEPGDFSVEWDGRDSENEELRKGDYTFQLEIGNSLSELKTISLNQA